MRLGFVIRHDSVDAIRLCRDMIRYAEELGLKPYIDEGLRGVIGYERTFRLGLDSVNFIVVIGGDGTILRTLHKLRDLEIPLITFRVGSRGFLCDLEPSSYRDALNRLVNGDYRLTRYLRLVAKVGETALPYVLNEYAVVTTGFWRSKVAKASLFKDSELIYEVLGDGVVVSTPIGSTAYNLAAGGPILDPEVNAFVVTPVAPLRTNLRPVVLPASTKLKIVIDTESVPLSIIADGALEVSLRPGDEVLITRAPRDAVFVKFGVGGHYEKVFRRRF